MMNITKIILCQRKEEIMGQAKQRGTREERIRMATNPTEQEIAQKRADARVQVAKFLTLPPKFQGSESEVPKEATLSEFIDNRVEERVVAKQTIIAPSDLSVNSPEDASRLYDEVSWAASGGLPKEEKPVQRGNPSRAGVSSNRWINNSLTSIAISTLISRHNIPTATVDHPKGVIVPGDDFMTKKLKDRDYVPYCSIKAECGRVRRVADGFECPYCGNKMNYDLTHFNGNVDVKYESKEEGNN
jgi:hypothetical protein